MNHSVFSKSDLLLLREASLSSMAIGTGLTYIGRYDFAEYGYFYSGLQSLCVGIERLLKLILIYDYRLINQGQFPANKYLKPFGHNLTDLIAKARLINQAHSTNVEDNFLSDDELYQKIISMMTDFALSSRYYNLDYLSGGQPSGVEPLQRWDEEICSAILNRHHVRSSDNFQQNNDLATFFDSFSVTRFTHENGDEIATAFDQLAEGDESVTKQLYSKVYLFAIVRFLSRLHAELEYKGAFLPYLREFFATFLIEDEEHVLEKASWNPIPPYHF